jgi:hypothetical protein
MKEFFITKLQQRDDVFRKITNIKQQLPLRYKTTPRYFLKMRPEQL